MPVSQYLGGGGRKRAVGVVESGPSFLSHHHNARENSVHISLPGHLLMILRYDKSKSDVGVVDVKMDSALEILSPASYALSI